MESNPRNLTIDDLNLNDVKFEEENQLSILDGTVLTALLDAYYYQNKKLTELLNDFQLDIRSSKFANLLPLIGTGFYCPYDGNEMFSAMPSRTSKDSWDNDIVCPICEHTIYRREAGRYRKGLDCKCAGCLSKQEAAQKLIRDGLKRSIEEASSFSYNALSLENIINLATLLQGVNADNLNNVGPLTRYLGNPGMREANFVEQLFKENILMISEKSPEDAFFDIESDGSCRYYTARVTWVVNIHKNDIDDKTLLNLLKFPNAGLELNFSSAELQSFYSQLVVDELERCAKFQIDKFGLSYEGDEDRDKMQSALIRWLGVYTPAQIYALLWQAVRKVDNARSEGTWGNYRFHQTQFVIKAVDQIIERKTKKHLQIEDYNYPHQMDMGLRTKIFFTELLNVPDWFQRPLPQINQDYDETASLRSLSDVSVNTYSNLNLIPIILTNAKSYSMKDCGLAVYDGHDEILFSDQVSVYLAYVQTNANQWFEVASDEYKIERFYTFSFISALLSNLQQMGIPYVQEPQHDSHNGDTL